jgi:glutamine synthetase type III
VFHFAANEDAEPQIKKRRFRSSRCASSSNNFEFGIVNQSKEASSNEVVAFISVASKLTLWISGFGLERVSLLLSLVPFSFS